MHMQVCCACISTTVTTASTGRARAQCLLWNSDTMPQPLMHMSCVPRSVPGAGRAGSTPSPRDLSAHTCSRQSWRLRVPHSPAGQHPSLRRLCRTASLATPVPLLLRRVNLALVDLQRRGRKARVDVERTRGQCGPSARELANACGRGRCGGGGGGQAEAAAGRRAAAARGARSPASTAQTPGRLRPSCCPVCPFLV